MGEKQEEVVMEDTRREKEGKRERRRGERSNNEVYERKKGRGSRRGVGKTSNREYKKRKERGREGRRKKR